MWKDDLKVFLEHLERVENAEQVKKNKADQKLLKNFAKKMNQPQKKKKRAKKNKD